MVGGLLLVFVLGFVVIGLYNFNFDGKYVLLDYGVLLLVGVFVVVVVFFGWECFVCIWLIDLVGVYFWLFLFVLGVFVVVGVVLMVMLVDVELFG